MSDREWARARVAARAFLRDNYPDAQWDAIDDLSRALTHELYVGPMPYGYWSDKEGGDALCVQPWPGWSDGCKMLSGLIEVLPVELYYDADSGYVTTSNPYDWEEVYTMPTIEALFDKELWRYLT
jgi:hypothetical protein